MYTPGAVRSWLRQLLNNAFLGLNPVLTFHSHWYVSEIQSGLSSNNLEISQGTWVARSSQPGRNQTSSGSSASP